ncbi:MAG TPA: hypothetical protein VIQ31_01935 [Phormidium sp.]
MTQWRQKGIDLANQIKDLDTDSIESLCQKLLIEVAETYPNFNSRKTPIKNIRIGLIDNLESETTAFNIALDVITPKNSKEIAQIKITQKATSKSKQWSLKNMQLKQLELDTETQEITLQALEQTGLDLAEFIKQSIRVYSKTVTGKTRKHGGDLASVPTKDLLEDSKYATHPGRAEEVIRRAINAIKIYNSEEGTEPNQRWIITQSLLTELTGSRASSVKAAMQKYRDDIDSHHQKYPDFFNEDGETLKQYHNRKKTKIGDVINLADRDYWD